MPVQVPTLERFAPQATPSVGRIAVEPVNTASLTSTQFEAADNVVRGTADFFIKQEADKINTDTLAKSLEYETWAENRLTGPEGIKYMTGDPTTAYAKFDEEKSAKIREMIDSSADTSQEYRDALEARLNKTDFKIDQRKNQQYGYQYNIYKTNIVEASVEKGKQNLIEASTYALTPGVDDNFNAVSATLEQIADLRAEAGIANGQVTVDEKGNKVINDPSLQMQIVKDQSEGLENIISNYAVSGRPDLAEKLMKKHGSMLFPDKVDKLNKAIKDSKLKTESARLAVKIEVNGLENAAEELDKIKDDELKLETSKLIDDLSRRRENIAARASKDNYNSLANYMLDREKGPEGGYTSRNEMERDPVFQSYITKITDSKQRKAIYERVDTPSESKPEAWETALSTLQNNGLKGMPPSDLALLQQGLNKEDKAMMEYEWRKQNTESPGEARSNMNFLMSKIDEQAYGLKIIRGKKGAYNPSDVAWLNQLKMSVWKEADNLKNLSIPEAEKFASDLIAKESVAILKKRNEGFLRNIFNKTTDLPTLPVVDPSILPRKFTVKPAPVQTVVKPDGGTTQVQTSSIGGKELKTFTSAERQNLIQQYKNENGKFPTSKELTDYLNKMGGK